MLNVEWPQFWRRLVLDHDLDIAVFAPGYDQHRVLELLSRMASFTQSHFGVFPVADSGDASGRQSLVNPEKRCHELAQNSKGIYRCEYRHQPVPVSVLTLVQHADFFGELYTMRFCQRHGRIRNCAYVDFFFYNAPLLRTRVVRWEGRSWPAVESFKSKPG